MWIAVTVIGNSNLSFAQEDGINFCCSVLHIVGSPLKQFKSGISLDDITCKDGFFLAVSVEKNPICLKPDTISKLASRGFFYGINSNEIKINYTTILIPPGSENQAANKTYSPNLVKIMIGVNNTVRWVNQSPDTGNTIAEDINDQNYGKTFNSSLLKPGQSYEFTFTRPGTYHYHGEPHPWQVGTVIVIQPTNGTVLPASFMPCDTPYPQSNTGVAVLYMPANSIGKICVRYSNPDDISYPIGIRFFDANNINKNATGITTWNDSGNNTISKGNYTIVYWINTGNQTGFYGLTFFCNDWNPLAVGYDSNSNMTKNDFPFLRETFPCPFEPYHLHIDSLTGIGVKHIP